MTVMVFGYLIVISGDFYDFISPFPRCFKFRLRRYLKHSRQCLTTFANASKFVKNTSLRDVFFCSALGVWICDQTRSIVFK